MDVMDNIVYSALCRYYKVLEHTGYVSYADMVKLLILVFFRDYIQEDYRGVISKEDYYLIERALECLFGSTCLIPYPDYLKMGKLHLGEITEMAQRVKTLEDTEVLKAFDADGTCNSDIIITSEED